MRVRVVFVLTAAVLMLWETGTLRACGDKFLMIGKGAKFRQAYAAIYPASVVVVALPQRESGKALRDPRLLTDLKQAGHQVAVVEDERALAQALTSGRVDVLLTDAADADRMAALAIDAPTRPHVLPVMFKPTKQQLSAVEARYKQSVKSGDRSIKYLSAIEDVMKAKKKKA
jgi:hypothetical protein